MVVCQTLVGERLQCHQSNANLNYSQVQEAKLEAAVMVLLNFLHLFFVYHNQINSSPSNKEVAHYKSESEVILIFFWWCGLGKLSITTSRVPAACPYLGCIFSIPKDIPHGKQNPEFYVVWASLWGALRAILVRRLGTLSKRPRLPSPVICLEGFPQAKVEITVAMECPASGTDSCRSVYVRWNHLWMRATKPGDYISADVLYRAL